MLIKFGNRYVASCLFFIKLKLLNQRLLAIGCINIFYIESSCFLKKYFHYFKSSTF